MSGTMRASAVSALGNLPLHWPEYLMEAGELALYMFATCAFATLLQHPASPVRHLIVNGFYRRAVIGLGMGATVVAIVMSPWGKQSGAHFNPGVTLTFYRLGKMDFSDAALYIAAQFLGGIGGVVIATQLLGGAPGGRRSRLRSDNSWQVWKRYRLCRRNDDFFYSDDDDPVRV